jgi:hypothetical protein
LDGYLLNRSVDGQAIIKAYTYTGEKLMTKNKFGLMAIVLFLTIAGAIVSLKRVTAQMQDKIEYNQVYDCGDGSKSKFKVLSCKGTGKFDRCEVFYINELSPGGGNKVSTYRSGIEDDINQGCKIKGRPAVNNEPDENEERENETPVSKPNNSQNNTLPNKENNSSVACFASDPDSNGKTANEKTFMGVIRRLWEKEALEGSDGAVTITFQKMIIGAPRRWRPTFDDAYSQADPKKSIYPVRAAFTTCTDYRSAIERRKMERIYDCFVHKTGGWQCTQTGASGALATKDKGEYIQKQR